MNPSEPPRPRPVYRRRRYPVTGALVALDTIIFTAIWIQGPGAKEAALLDYGHLKEAVWAGEVWRLLTAVFLHDGWFHLFINMFVLWSIGRHVERLVGCLRFLSLFLASGLAGSLFFQATSSAGLAVGASGAVAGVVGAFLIVWARFTSRSSAGALLRFGATFAFLVLGDLVFGYVAQRIEPAVGIAISAHFGGLLTGSALGFAFGVGEAAVPRPLRRLVPIAAALAAFFGIAVYLGGASQRTELADLARLREVMLQLERGDPEGALASWRELRASSPEALTALGYGILDRLMAEDRKDLAAELLDDLIRISGENLARLEGERGRKSPDTILQSAAFLENEMAWFMAFRGQNLEEALHRAERAVSIARAMAAAGWLERVLGTGPGPEALAAYLNTQGWIEVLLGRHDAGIEHLTEAARMVPSPSHYLWLALAHERTGNRREAQDAARLARKAGELQEHYERRLLEELEADLGG